LPAAATRPPACFYQREEAMKRTHAIAVLATLFASAPCLAREPAPQPAPQPVQQQSFGASIDESELAQIAGREDLQQDATNAQVAGVSRNSVGANSKTGDVAIAGSAFQNLSGLSVLSVNTGNNVAMNASMNVNIAILPQ
jgi:hypothetical protein